jgi:hypothetical protein
MFVMSVLPVRRPEVNAKRCPPDLNITPIFEGLPVSDSYLKKLSLRAALWWAADNRGCLLRDRLKQVAQARGYSSMWVSHNRGRHWEEVFDQMKRWAREQHGLRE